MVYEIWNQAVMAPHRRASLVVDLHCHQSATAVYAHTHMAADLGVVAGLRNIVVTGDSGKIAWNSGVCTRNGIMGMTIELCGQGVLRAGSIREGQKALTNLLKFYGMLRGKLDLPSEALILDPWRSDRPMEKFGRTSYLDGKAGGAGLMVPHMETYDTVRKGDLVCDIVDPHTGRIVAQHRAGMSGCLYMLRFHEPVCRKNERIFTVSIVRKVRPAAYVKRLSAARYRDPELVTESSEFMLAQS